MGRLLAAIGIAIALLTAGTLLLVQRLTEPATPELARPQGASAPAGEPPASTSWFQWGRDQAGFQASGEPGAPTAGPGSSTASGPAPAGLSEASEEQDESRASIKQQRRASKVEKLNRLNQQRRGGTPREDPSP